MPDAKMVFPCTIPEEAREILRGGCPAGFAGAREDPVAGLVLCTPSLGWVDLSVINGEIIVKDGKLLTLNVQV